MHHSLFIVAAFLALDHRETASGGVNNKDSLYGTAGVILSRTNGGLAFPGSDTDRIFVLGFVEIDMRTLWLRFDPTAPPLKDFKTKLPCEFHLLSKTGQTHLKVVDCRDAMKCAAVVHYEKRARRFEGIYRESPENDSGNSSSARDHSHGALPLEIKFAFGKDMVKRSRKLYELVSWAASP